MIIRLSPEQIAEVWDYIRPGILETLTPVAEVKTESIQRVLRSFLSEDMQLWLGLEDPSDKATIYGYMVTVIYKDIVTDTSSLLIYSLVQCKEMPLATWQTGLRKLQDFAQANKCFQLMAYTDVPRMVEITKSLGFQTMTFLRKEV